MKNDTDSNISNESITYALGYIEATISKIARDNEQSESQLREWVAILLLSSGTGTINNLSTLRRNPPKAYKAVREMEVDERTHRKPQGKIIPRKVGHTKKGFKYNGTHWTQQPKNKKRLQALARAKFEKKKVA